MHYKIELNGPEDQEADELRNVDTQASNLLALERMANDHTQQRIDHQAAEPGLDTVPAAGHQCAQNRRELCAPGAKRCARQHRIGNAIFGARMPDEQHRHEHDHVRDEDGHDRLHGRHAALHQAGCQRVGRNAHHHAYPQRREVVPRPRSLRCLRGCEVVVPEATGFTASGASCLRVMGHCSLLERCFQ
ncbi:hypothetical protein D3C72_1743580 [compost metagenome]